MLTTISNSDPQADHFVMIYKQDFEGIYDPILKTESKHAIDSSTTIDWNTLYSDTDTIGDSDPMTHIKMILYAHNKRSHQHIPIGECVIQFGDLQK